MEKERWIVWRLLQRVPQDSDKGAQINMGEAAARGERTPARRQAYLSSLLADWPPRARLVTCAAGLFTLGWRLERRTWHWFVQRQLSRSPLPLTQPFRSFLRIDMTTAIYTRVSSRQQDQRGQLLDLERWAKQLDSPPLWFHDTKTGKDMAREAFNSLLDECRSGKVKTIVVWRLDRLGRTARGLTELFEELQRLGVVLISLKEGVDLSTPAGRLICNVLASVAQFETEVRGERQRAGIEAARAAGKRWGGSRPGPRKLDRAKVEMLRANGLNHVQIAGVLKISLSSVKRALRR